MFYAKHLRCTNLSAQRINERASVRIKSYPEPLQDLLYLIRALSLKPVYCYVLPVYQHSVVPDHASCTCVVSITFGSNMSWMSRNIPYTDRKSAQLCCSSTTTISDHQQPSALGKIGCCTSYAGNHMIKGLFQTCGVMLPSAQAPA
jgi:hypothetical protein